MRSYVIQLTGVQTAGIPLILDGYYYFDFTGGTVSYPATADGSLYTTTSAYVYPVTAWDGLYNPWGYGVTNTINNINIGTLKGPYTIVFSPTGYNDTNFGVLKIIYDFGNGQTQIVDRSVIDAIVGNGYGLKNPINSIITHDYYPLSGVTTFTPTVSVINGNLTQTIFKISITLVPASIYELNDVHLLSFTQSNIDSTETVNIFEIQTPNYITNARIKQ